MTARELYFYLQNKIPSSLSCEWDNDGLMCCPDPENEVKKVLIALDITERTVDYAIANGFDTIISHHPLIFHKVATLEPSDPTARKLIKLTQSGICAMSFHTRLDAVKGGVNDALANTLGLCDIKPFGTDEEPIGRIGTLPSPVKPDVFCENVKKALGAPAVLASLSGNNVYKVALVGGDGKDFVDAAIMHGADTYISGRISYNIMAEAPEKHINLIEAGHFFTENPVCCVIRDMIRGFDPEIKTEIINSNEIRLY